jgi:hypothetical protein
MNRKFNLMDKIPPQHQSTVASLLGNKMVWITAIIVIVIGAGMVFNQIKAPKHDTVSTSSTQITTSSNCTSTLVTIKARETKGDRCILTFDDGETSAFYGTCEDNNAFPVGSTVYNTVCK